jgi:predicted dehydrogenase
MSRTTRRRFLEDSLLATAAALAVPAAAAPRTAEASRSRSSLEKISVACIGVRGRGGSHLEAFAGGADTEVTYVCDVDEKVAHSRAQGVEQKQGRAPKIVTDMRRIFEDPSVHVVTTATPNHWHSLASIWAMQAGKDVYVEKPVSHNVSEGRRMVQAARKYGRICQTGTQCRSNPGTFDAIAFIRSGGIGKVKLARGLCYKERGPIGPRGEYPVPSEVDYELWCGPAPKRPLTRRQLHYDWHWIWDYGNGDLGNQGIHQMDIARWGLGVSTLGDSVVSYGGRLGYEDAGETANTQVSIHSFGEQTLVFEVRGLRTDPLESARVGVIFYGSDGYLALTSYTSGTAFDLKGNVIKKFSGGDDDLHFNNFLKAVKSRSYTDLTADVEEGHLSSALCHLGNISYRLGEAVPVDGVRERLKDTDENRQTFERFTDHLAANGLDPSKTSLVLGPSLALDGKAECFTGEWASKADPMLTRPYRKGFEVPSAENV